MKTKTRDLIFLLLIYLLAYYIGFKLCLAAPSPLLRYFVFDIIATVVTFIFSVILRNSSVYDPYWSLTPMVMSVFLFFTSKSFSIWQILFLTVFNIWGLRLTVNWITVTTGFSYEDWRYIKYREENSPAMWFIINFFGIHMVPTLVVFAGMLPIFEIAKKPLGPYCLFGIAIMGVGILLEFFADRQMHRFLNEAQGRKEVCRTGLWNISRHPNYLGEISFWTGVFFTMLPYSADKWYYAVGCISVAVLFNTVSIPLMEKRQLARREDYTVYCQSTPRLLPIPKR